MMVKREKITPERAAMLRCWHHRGFSLDSSRRVEADDRKSLESLLQYIQRPPVSLERLTYRQDGLVHERGGKYHSGLGKDHQLLTPLEFLAMLVPHITPRYEVTTRSYGALSSTKRKSFGWIEEKPQVAPCDLLTVEDEESEFVKVRKRNSARLIASSAKSGSTIQLVALPAAWTIVTGGPCPHLPEAAWFVACFVTTLRVVDHQSPLSLLRNSPTVRKRPLGTQLPPALRT